MKFTRERMRKFTPAQIIVFYYFMAIAFIVPFVELAGRL